MNALQIINIRAPQFSSDARLSDLIFLSRLQTSTQFGDSYELAVALRVLHWLTRERLAGGTGASYSGSGVAGTIQSESEGALSRSRGVSQQFLTRWGDLATTAYGCELIELIRGSFVFPRTRRMDDGVTQFPVA